MDHRVGAVLGLPELVRESRLAYRRHRHIAVTAIGTFGTSVSRRCWRTRVDADGAPVWYPRFEVAAHIARRETVGTVEADLV